eukprot:CAMPEP_0196583200 /NCGR_PEP_ID=MMETSP1081-20130531/42494_1 /TAXON_ID=36882 /ORGANISM="Pyramimonas amylifera, Strain CCMP720" /LENGTH=57 /DNA_ID=CAMNT_0041904011 /DNA_START=158 /DNA_END=327 /DNA_ORIENTATION=+
MQVRAAANDEAPESEPEELNIGDVRKMHGFGRGKKLSGLTKNLATEGTINVMQAAWA